MAKKPSCSRKVKAQCQRSRACSWSKPMFMGYKWNINYWSKKNIPRCHETVAFKLRNLFRI